VIRPATIDELPALFALWQEFHDEVPPPDYDPIDLEHELKEIEECVRSEIALVAEEDGELVGLAFAHMKSDRLGFLTDLYVRRELRGTGIARALVHRTTQLLREQGADVVRLEVLAGNANARAVYERWGFELEELKLVADATTLEQRVAERERLPSFGSVHVQTDDRVAVERTVHKLLPRLGRTGGTEISEPRNGWVAVYDELCSREPPLLQRLARELSYTSGTPTLAIGVEDGAVVRYTLFDRGGAVDEYLSVPEYYGPLPPGDTVALGANPTVVARLTGADPARVRAVARTASNPDELPPATELLRELAETLRIEGADRGWQES
jgi:ribosomal protein S18 acetylase RimI-like enzyme